MVPVPKSPSRVKCQLLVREIRDRLASTGFTHMALTHTIYGRPRPAEDRAEAALPNSLWMAEETPSSKNPSTANEKKGNASGVSSGKKRKLDDASSGTSDRSDNNNNNNNNNDIPASIRVLRRLHVVIENESDTSVFLSNGPQSGLLNEYDLVSISPTNDATFQFACASATMADVITLDYHTGRGMRLPYRIRTADVQAAMKRGATFEFPLSPALLHLKQRKALVTACREFQNGSLGLKPRVIISSGDRALDGSDVGAMALRMPGDLSNLCKVVMQFDASTSAKAVGAAALDAIRRGEQRRHGGTIPTKVRLLSKKDLLERPVVVPSNENRTKAGSERAVQSVTESDGRSMPILEDKDDANDHDHHGADDGFIAM
jgi:RNase P/RNase MRP subunit p30